MNSYVDRNRLVRQLGFPSYDKYLASALWRTIKERQLKDVPLCEVCNEPAQVVHHAAYDLFVLNGDGSYKHFLHSLCHGCHHGIEFDGSRKLSLEEANERLFRCIDTSKKPPPPHKKKTTPKPRINKAYFRAYNPNKKRKKNKGGAIHSRWCNRCNKKTKSPYRVKDSYCKHCGLDGKGAMRIGQQFNPNRDQRPPKHFS